MKDYENYVIVTRRSRMMSAVKKGIIVAALYALCFTLIVEGKPELYSCSLQVDISFILNVFSSPENIPSTNVP